MTKRTMWVAVVGLVAVLVAGGLFASNMGFKLNYALLGPGASPQNGTNSIALPYNAQTGLNNAEDLANDIGGFTGGGGPVVNVSRYVPAIDGVESYTGSSGTPFPLTPGEGYRVQVNTDVNYIIVGSHDPVKLINLLGPGVAPQNGTNSYAYPYHSTSTNAEELAGEIGGFTGGGGPVVNVSRYVPAIDGVESYTGSSGTPFPLKPGEAYRIQVNADTSFTPSHY